MGAGFQKGHQDGDQEDVITQEAIRSLLISCSADGLELFVEDSLQWCHQGVGGAAGQQAFKCPLLMEIGREGKRDLWEPVPPRALAERQGHGNEGPFEQLIAIGQEAIDQTREPRCCGVERGADGVAGHLLQLAGYNGREQDLPRICTSKLGGIASQGSLRNHAVCAWMALGQRPLAVD